MIENGIIAILLSVCLWQTWRKRVWKRRALQQGPSYWAAFWQGFVDQLEKPKEPVKKDEAWPEVLDAEA